MRTLEDLRRVYRQSINAGASPEEAANDVERELVRFYGRPENEAIIRENGYLSKYTVNEAVMLLMTTVWGWVNEIDGRHETSVRERVQ